MFDLRKIPMLRALLPFFCGVLVGFQVFFSDQLIEISILSLFLWLLIFATFKLQKRKVGTFPRLIYPLLFLLFFLVGVGTGIESRPVDPGLPEDQWVLIRGEVNGQPRPGTYAYTFEMKLQMLSSADTLWGISNLLKCYMSMPADSVMPCAGEIWQFSGKLLPIRNSGNPGSPDYRSILGRKNCWYRFYASTNETSLRFNREICGVEKRFTPAFIRSLVSDHWHGELEEVSLLKAVCLGDRSSLTGDMRQAYTAAGGMHLLAVSGLHVGLIWWVLQYLTSWMSLIFRKGIQRTVLIVGLLWFYAFITGFSSSVCRSVTMFSFFSIGRMMGERSHPLNVIFASAFLLVLIAPERLMDLGFHLSYLAIIGIIILHPLIVRTLRVKNRILRWIWEATSVSLAAQLSTAALVIYYFNQLPVYSLISSLIAVPMLSILIAIFVCSVPFVLCGALEQFSSVLLMELARLMNCTMKFLSSLPGAVQTGLELNRYSLLVWLLILLMALQVLHGRRKMLYPMGLLIAALLLGNSLSNLKLRSSSELVVAHFKGASMLSIREGKQVDHYCWYRDSSSREYMEVYRASTWSRRKHENHLYEMEEGKRIRGKISSCLPLGDGSWLLGGQEYAGLVLTSRVKGQIWDKVYADRACHQINLPDFVLLSGEPVLNRMFEQSCFLKVDLLLDGSNRSWYRERMKAEWDSLYLTEQSGAYVKRW